MPLTMASDTPKANPTPVPQSSNPICVSAVLLPLVAVVWFVWKRS